MEVKLAKRPHKQSIRMLLSVLAARLFEPCGRQGGLRFGKTDDYGYYAVENKVHFHDLHATILHLMGLDLKRLTYRYAGRNFRLTDVHGRVVNEIIS